MNQTFMLPDAGEGLTEADIVQWLVAPGDPVAVNQVIVEVETAKSLVELPCPYAGVVTALHAEVGETVAVGSPLISVATAVASAPPDSADDPTDIDPTAANPIAGDSATPDGPATVEGAERDASAGSGSIDEPTGVLVGYGVRPLQPAHSTQGGPTTSGEATTSTDSRVLENGVAPGSPASQADDVRVGDAESDDARPDGYGHLPASPVHGAGAPPVLAKPPVRLLARELGLDLATIAASGPGGIVTREDVLAAQRAQAARTLAAYPGDDSPWLTGGVISRDGRTTRVPVRSVRKRTAEAMVTSAFTAPHVSVFHTLDVTRTMRLVAELREDREFAGVRVTPLLIAMKALLIAVRRHPEVNASWDEATREIVYKHYVNLGIAAATPRGLIVPNIKNAHRLSLRELAEALAELTDAARSGATTPAALSDGTITITNVGVFGIDTGTPILNPGEAAILAFGAITRQPWVHKGKVRPRWVTQLALSFDHRLVDGELGSRVLADVAAILHDPARGLVWG